MLPLDGLTVIELHAIGPVPFAGMQLHKMGAHVIRVCPPNDRNIGIEIGAEADLLNTGKEQRQLDLKSADGIEQLHALLEEADVLLEGFRPGVLERLNLDPATVTAQHPRLVIGRLSGFGNQGDLSERAGHDINYLALSGVLASIGTHEKPAIPLNLVGDFGGGAMHLLIGVLAQLVQRGISGNGGVVTTSILGGTIGLTPMIYGLIAGGRWDLARESNLLDGALPFYRVYKTRDEQHVAVGALEAKFFKGLLELTGLNQVIDAGKQWQSEHWPSMTMALSSAFASRDRDSWATDAAAIDCCVSPVLDFEEAAHFPHNLANGWYDNQSFAKPVKFVDFNA